MVSINNRLAIQACVATALIIQSFAFQVIHTTLPQAEANISISRFNLIRNHAQSTLKSSIRDDCNEDLSNPEISRYSRHLVLGDVGMKGQKNLKNASVLVIGAGGLGSPCLLYLAAAGVGYIGIVVSEKIQTSLIIKSITLH